MVLIHFELVVGIYEPFTFTSRWPWTFW